MTWLLQCDACGKRVPTDDVPEEWFTVVKGPLAVDEDDEEWEKGEERHFCKPAHLQSFAEIWDPTQIKAKQKRGD